MRVATACWLLILLAACAGSGPTPLPSDAVRVSFPAHGIADQIEIEAVGRLPLRQAALIAPDGKATAANAIEAHPSDTLTASQSVANRPYAGTLTGPAGAQPSVPLPAGAAPQSQTRLLAMVSTASIALPDPVAYRNNWRRYRIELRFGSPPGPIESKTLPAPKPPPGT